MKVLAVVLPILFLFAILYSPASSSLYAPDTTFCCFSYTHPRPPQFQIKEYFYTNSRCSNMGVIFITKKKRHLCANPKKKWVQTYIDFIKKKVHT